MQGRRGLARPNFYCRNMLSRCASLALRRQTRPASSAGKGSALEECSASLNGAAVAHSNGAAVHSNNGAGGRMRAPDGREALAFLRAHSPEGDAQLLPGLCQFCERWMEQVPCLARACPCVPDAAPVHGGSCCPVPVLLCHVELVLSAA